MSDKGKIRHLWLVRLACDIFAVAAAYYTTLIIRFHSAWGERLFTAINRFLGVRETGSLGEILQEFYTVSAPRIIFFLVITLCVLYALCGLYPGRRFIRRRPIAWNVILANAIALAMFYAYFYLRRNVFHPRSYFATLLFFNVCYCVGFRRLADIILDGLRQRFGLDRWNAILIGNGEEASFIKILVDETRPHGIQLVDQIEVESGHAVDRLVETLETTCRQHRVDVVFVADDTLTVNGIMRILELSDDLKVSVKVLSDTLAVLIARARIATDLIRGKPLIHFEARTGPDISYLLRRAIGMSFALVATVVLLPAMGLIALAVVLSSRGAPFFVQERIGVNRKPFKIYKFRTMYDKAAELQAQVEEFNETDGALFKIRKDPRITPFGRFLRRFSLDELPQLFNVLKKEMVIVGPRPLPRRDFENYYEEWHYSRHSGMPGLTCLWQVSGRSDLDFHEMCVLDVYYLHNQNWILDLTIILRTFYVVVFAKGAY